MPSDFRRQVAFKLKISDVESATYKKEDGNEPNHLLTRSGIKVSRVNIVAVVVSKSDEGSYDSIVLDDRTGKITARAFESAVLKKIEIGDIVLIIGKPREFGNEIYILPEIVRKLPDHKWLEVRKMELHGKEATVQDMPEKIIVEQPMARGTENVIEMIRKMDSGDGADLNDIIKQGGDEKTITYLIKRGDIYQIRPGRLKILE